MEEPPHDLIAEQSVLGSMLLSKDSIPVVAEILNGTHFYRPNHTTIYQAITTLVSEGEPIDAVTVGRQLELDGDLRRIGGAPYLLTLISTVPTASNASSYARVVFDKARQRAILEAGQRFMQLGYADATSTEDVDSLLAEADTIFRDLGQPSRSGIMWDDLVKKWTTWQDDKTDVIPTPWVELNRWLPGGGFHLGSLVIFGARPGDGKSNAGLNVSLTAAEAGRSTSVFSVEMDDVEVTSRLLAAGSYSPLGQIIGKRMEPEVWERVDSYIRERAGMNLEVIDQPHISVEEIVGHCRTRQPQIIFVDYAQLISGSQRIERRELIAHVTRSLKIAAKQQHMLVIAASQLNRESTKNDHGPSLSNLAEGDAIGRDADIVLLLQRDDKVARMICAKNRNGRTGSLELTFRGDMARLG